MRAAARTGSPPADRPAMFPCCSPRRSTRCASRAGGVYLDGTFGAGGYSRALLERGARVIAIDRDPAAIAGGAALVAEFAGRLTLVEGRFGELDAIARGSASRARRRRARHRRLLDAARRGRARLLAALRRAARHAHGRQGRSAADILREDDEATIADILSIFGEERAARRIARAIVADRDDAPYRLDAAARRA